MQAGGRGFESLDFHHQQHAASCGCLWACIVLLLIRSTVICAELLNYDHEDECLVRAAWTSDLHRASSSRKNAVPSGETGCGIDEEHHPRQSSTRIASTGQMAGNARPFAANILYPMIFVRLHKRGFPNLLFRVKLHHEHCSSCRATADTPVEQDAQASRNNHTVWRKRLRYGRSKTPSVVHKDGLHGADDGQRRGTTAANILLHGRVSEWPMELVLKTSDAASVRGFESHPVRHDFAGSIPAFLVL